jgi:hypothetical protein
MKVVLLVLSGDASFARTKLATTYPQAEVQIISRSDIEGTGLSTRLRKLRALHPGHLCDRN